MNQAEKIFYLRQEKSLLKLHDMIMSGNFPGWDENKLYDNNEIFIVSVDGSGPKNHGRVKFYKDKDKSKVIVLWKNGDFNVKLELMTHRRTPSGNLWYIPVIIIDFGKIASFECRRSGGFYYKINTDRRTPYELIKGLIDAKKNS